MKDFLEESEVMEQGQDVGVLRVPKGLDIYRPDSEKTIRFMIVPYKATISPYADPGDLWYACVYWQWRNLGEGGKGSCINLKKTFNKRDAIAEALADYDGPKDAKPYSQRKALLNIYFPDTDELKIMDFSYANFIELVLENMKLKRKNNPDKYGYLAHFCDPQSPTLFQVTFKEGSYSGTKFFKAADFEYDQSEKPIPKAILQKAADLDAMLITMSYAEQAAAFLGEEGDDGEDLPAATKKAEPPAAKKEVEDDEPVVERPKATKPPKQEEEVEAPKPPKKEWGSDIVAGSILFHGDRKVSVLKVKEDVVTVEYQDDESTAKVNASDLTKAAVAKEKPKTTKSKAAKETVPADGEKMPWDAEWEDAD